MTGRKKSMQASAPASYAGTPDSSHLAEGTDAIIKIVTRLREAHKAEEAALSAAHSLRVDVAAKRIPDYGDVMFRMRGVIVSDNLINEIRRSYRSAEVAYYLALHPSVLNAIKDLSGRDLTFEIGRITGVIDAVGCAPKVRVKMGRGR